MNKQDDLLIPYIGKTAKLMEAFISGFLQEKGYKITKEQWILLHHLSKHENIPQHKLACISNRDKTSLTRIVNTLEKKELVFRVADVEDKRIKLIRLTPLGEKVILETNHFFEDINKSLTRGISKKETKQVIDIIQRIQENINAELCK